MLGDDSVRARSSDWIRIQWSARWNLRQGPTAEFLTEQVWGGAWEPALVTNTQTMLALQLQGTAYSTFHSL